MINLTHFETRLILPLGLCLILTSCLILGCKSPYRSPLLSSEESMTDQGIDDIEGGSLDPGGMGGQLGGVMNMNPPPSTCDAQGPSKLYAIHVMKFALVNQGISSGFNLDGEVSQLAGDTGCGRSDFVDEHGRQGVDNQFAELIPVLDPILGQPLNEALERTISEKAFIILLEVQGIDHPLEDDCVQVNLFRATPQVLVGNDGYLLEGQSYAIDPDLPWAKAPQAWIEDGRVITTGFELELPISFSAITLNLFLDQSYLEFDLNSTLSTDEEGSTPQSTETQSNPLASLPSEIQGILGGSLPLEPLIETIADIEASIVGVARQLLLTKADLAPNEAGLCQAISIAWTFEARQGYLYLDSWYPQ